MTPGGRMLRAAREALAYARGEATDGYAVQAGKTTPLGRAIERGMREVAEHLRGERRLTEYIIEAPKSARSRKPR